VNPQPNYLRDAKIHQALSGVFGWIWLLGTLAALVCIVTAIFGHTHWWVAISILVGAQICKGLCREYRMAGQKAVDDAIAAKQMPSDSKNRGLQESDAAARVELSRVLSSAEQLVEQWAELLETSALSYYLAESALPAPVDELKRAILIITATRQVRGDISESEIDVYRASYACLARAIPDVKARGVNDALASVTQAGGAFNLSSAQLQEALRGIASSIPDSNSPDAMSLVAEFDNRLHAMLASYAEDEA